MLIQGQSKAYIICDDWSGCKNTFWLLTSVTLHVLPFTPYRVTCVICENFEENFSNEINFRHNFFGASSFQAPLLDQTIFLVERGKQIYPLIGLSELIMFLITIPFEAL